MTERATGRHRACHKSTSSALATLTGPLSVVGDCVGTVRRSGVIIAMSSGLVATMALPAHAVSAGPPESTGPQTASIPAVPASGTSTFFSSSEGSMLTLPDGLAVEDGTVSAPAAATLDFEHTSFIAVPTPDGVTVEPAPRVDTAAPQVDLGLTGARTGTTTRGDAANAGSQGSGAQTAVTQPTTRREARASQGTSSSVGSTVKNVGLPSSKASAAASSGSAVVSLASRYLGTPYRFGGHRPGGFDCSGLVQYVYGQLGKKLPRTAAEQAAAVRHIPRSQARPGDLVLFAGGGHIAIYVGNGMMLDAPHTGSVVQIRKIYSANVSFGRVV